MFGRLLWHGSAPPLLGITHTAPCSLETHLCTTKSFLWTLTQHPTPKECTLGELGLGITNDLAAHLKKAEQHKTFTPRNGPGLQPSVTWISRV